MKNVRMGRGIWGANTWNRFPAAQEWLDRNSVPVSDTRQKFEQFMAAQARDTGERRPASSV